MTKVLEGGERFTTEQNIGRCRNGDQDTIQMGPDEISSDLLLTIDGQMSGGGSTNKLKFSNRFPGCKPS